MNDFKENTAILIPAYMPDQRLITLVDGLYEDGFKHILIIDDGSGKDFAAVFEQIKDRLFCTLLTHEVNMGKGQALKTGLHYFCNQIPECGFVLMADADGQHSRESIMNVAAALHEHQHALVLGVRNFAKQDVPLHNKLGNNITKSVMSLFLGKPISDTQTGLRAIDKGNAIKFLSLAGQRYEYEINMLLECKKQRIELFEVPIETIYINKNETSHFNPFIDSTKIYWQILKYSLSAGVATLIDLGLFTVIANLLTGKGYQIFIATLIARLASLACNYYANKKAVFKSEKRNHEAMFKYILLCAVNILFATWFTTLMVEYTPFSLLFNKIIVSVILFILNFFAQKKLVF